MSSFAWSQTPSDFHNPNIFYLQCYKTEKNKKSSLWRSRIFLVLSCSELTEMPWTTRKVLKRPLILYFSLTFVFCFLSQAIVLVHWLLTIWWVRAQVCFFSQTWGISLLFWHTHTYSHTDSWFRPVLSPPRLIFVQSNAILEMWLCLVWIVCLLKGMHGVAALLLFLGELWCFSCRGLGHCTEGLGRCCAHGEFSPWFLHAGWNLNIMWRVHESNYRHSNAYPC